MISHAETSSIKPENVINSSLLPEYNRRMDVFSDDLIIAHTNLSVLRQIKSFDEDLFEAPPALLSFLSTNLIDQILLILTRLWRDTARGVMTMDKFAKWLREKGVKQEYRDSVACTLDQAMPASSICDVLERCRKIRHARVAHLSAQLRLRTMPVLVRQEEVERAAEALGDLFNSMNFGAIRKLVLPEFQCDGQKYHEGDFGYMLDRIALGSKWFSAHVRGPNLWPHFRKMLSEEQLAKINDVGGRYDIAPMS